MIELEYYSNGFWGKIGDSFNDPFIPPIYSNNTWNETGVFTTNLIRYIIVEKNNNYGVIDTEGNNIISFKYKKIDIYNNRYIAAALELESSEKLFWGVIDLYENILIDFIYDNIEIVNSSDRFAFVTKDSISYYVTRKGEIFTENSLSVFQNIQNKKFGIMDKNKKVIVPAKYFDIQNFNGNFAIATKNISDSYLVDRENGIYEQGTEEFECYYLDKNGNETTIEEYNRVSNISEGIHKVCLSNFNDPDETRYGYVDINNRPLTKIEFFYALNFKNGMAAVANKNLRFGFIDNTGKLVIDFLYDEVTDFKNGYAKVSIDDDFFFINKTGSKILKGSNNKYQFDNRPDLPF